MTREEQLSRFDSLRTDYIKLLNDKDVLINWGKPQLEAMYATRIGTHQVSLLQMQLRTKALKRKLEMVRSTIARRQPLDVNEIELLVAAELADAELAIMQETIKVEKGKQLLGSLASPEQSAALRKIFRQLARQLHPDVNTLHSDEQMQIWHLVKDAYNNGNVEQLKALQLVYERALQQEAAAVAQLTVDELAKRNEILTVGINVLKSEIASIQMEFPFDVAEEINNEEWVKDQVEKILQALQTLRQLETELLQEYEALINGYGGTTTEFD